MAQAKRDRDKAAAKAKAANEAHAKASNQPQLQPLNAQPSGAAPAAPALQSGLHTKPDGSVWKQAFIKQCFFFKKKSTIQYRHCFLFNAVGMDE